jgi:hypothetical protein
LVIFFIFVPACSVSVGPAWPWYGARNNPAQSHPRGELRLV